MYFAILAFLLMLVGGSNSFSATSGNFITIGTGGVTGVYYPTGGAICRLVNRYRKEHGIRCSAESTGGSIYNINTIRAGEIEFGVAQSDWLYYAYHGTSKFEKYGANQDLRAIFSVHAEPLTIFARANAGIRNIGNFVDKRINIGNPGSNNRAMWELISQSFNWSSSDFLRTTELKTAEFGSALCDNKLDAAFTSIGHPNALTKQILSTCDIKLVEAVGPRIDNLIAQYPYFRKAVIPANMYQNREAIRTFGVGATFISSSQVPDEVVYAVVRSVFDHLDPLVDFASFRSATRTPNGEVDRRGREEQLMSVPVHVLATEVPSVEGDLSS